MFRKNTTPTRKTDTNRNYVVSLFIGLLILLFCASLQTYAKDNVLQLFEKEFKKVITKARPAVVKVLATRNSNDRLPPNIAGLKFTQQDISSGIILNKDGYIVTTMFNINPDKIEVTFNDGKRIPAKLIGVDQLTDIVVLKVDKKFPSLIEQGDSSKLDTGSLAITIGSSYGEHPIVSFGTVSGREFLPEHPCAELIKINAPVSPGNSGGAVINTSGEVVGMILAILTEHDVLNILQQPIQMTKTREITFAVPIDTVKSISTEIIQNGKVSRGWLGVQIETSDYGVFVTQVVRNSPAEKSGLLPRDIILEFNNSPVRNYFELLRQVGTSSPNTDITLKIHRDGREQKYTVTLGER